MFLKKYFILYKIVVNLSKNIQILFFTGLVGAATVLAPFFFIAAVLKVGNYANDAYRLGVHDGVCSRDPPPLGGIKKGLLRAAWLHGGPTAPFLHLIISHALIMARLVMEATLIRSGFLHIGK